MFIKPMNKKGQNITQLFHTWVRSYSGLFSYYNPQICFPFVPINARKSSDNKIF